MDEAKPDQPITKRLRTMNDISALEAVQLFHSVMQFDGGDPGDYSFRRGGEYPKSWPNFPDDIVYKDFMDGLMRYRQLKMEAEANWYPGSGVTYEPISGEQREELVKAVSEMPYEELKKLEITDAEFVVLHLLCKGYLDQNIASIRETSVRTINGQLQSIYRKLGVNSRTEAVAKVLKATQK
jgi:DNA-binding CsgD family transcriptional regulator